jgi:Tfp pilus assembly protein PilN
MMRAINLDFQATPARPWASLAILMCGVALFAITLLRYQNSVSDVALLEAGIVKVKGTFAQNTQRYQPAPEESAQRKEEIAIANGLIHQLTLPWEELFNSFELATNKEIALLSIEPDTKKKIVKVTAEAKTTKDMLAYIKRLQKSPMLDEVVLQKHEWQTKDPERPLRFTVASVWKDLK